MRRKLLSMLFFVFFSTLAIAQDRDVTGVVTDQNGDPLSGVSVVAKGTTTGSITGIDGDYKIKVPSSVTTLVFSYVGFKSQEVEIGSQTKIDLSLEEDAEVIKEVVVTALGISKEKASLGYGVTTVGSADLTARPEADVGRVLRGKVSGVDITQTSGIAGTGTNIIIRGFSSISGSNSPLFVVDGVPFDSDTNNDRGFQAGGATASSRFLDLDPNNIADISVLKGLAATVLYGEAGRNGVILVTTKTGQGGAAAKGTEVSFTQSVFFNEVAGVVDDQDAYGNGWQNRASAAFSNWGAPFNQPGKNGLAEDGTIAHPYDRSALNDVLPQYIGARYDYRPYDNLENFFVTGTQLNTSIGIDSRINEKSSMSFNYGYLSDNGFVENNEYKKHNFSIGGRTELQNGLKVFGSFNFITSDAIKPPAATIFSSNPAAGTTSLFSNVLYTPRSVSLQDLEFENPVTGGSIYYRGGNDIQHPLWTLNNASDEEAVRRFTGNVNLNYKLTDWLSVAYRIGIDTYTQKQDFKVDKGGINIPTGSFVTSSRVNFISDQVLNFMVDKDITSDLNFSGIIGTNLRRETVTRNFESSTDMFISDLFVHQNFQTQTINSFTIDENTPAVYANLTFGYKDFIYLGLQGRNDWSSTLEEENRSIFYPSVSLSVLPLEGLDISSSKVNLLKFRVGYGTSAGYPDPYATRNVLASDALAFNTRGGTTLQTLGVAGLFGNPNLGPERHSELEFGLEAQFFNSRIGVDLSIYDKTSSDLIQSLSLDPSTGYNVSVVNAAEVTNTGIELGLNFVPVRYKDFAWTSTINFTRNVNKVNQIAEGVDQVIIQNPNNGNLNNTFNTGFANLGNFAIPGEQFGIIQGSAILRDEAGNPIISPAGVYQQDPELRIIGNPNPDFNMTVINSFSWKSLSFRFQFDYVHGGDIWGGTASTLTARGIAGETDFDRFVPVVTTGVSADGSPNTVQITPNRHYWEHTGVFYDENRMFDGTTLRLREISLSYVLPKSILSKTPFGSASITFAGQNLWYRAFNFPESINFDPEVLSLGVGNGRGFDFVTGPTAKKYGATLSVTF